MQLLTITLIAVSLAMDALAVSLASGAAYKKLHIAHTFRVALFFGAFQALMPLIGYFAGQTSINYLSKWNQPVAFTILMIIGIKMIYEAFQLEKTTANPAKLDILLLLSVATSLDALAVGFTLSLIDLNIIIGITIIGIVTFVLSLAGVFLGKKLGHIFDKRIEILGGVILIGLALKIIVKHFT